MKRYRIGYRAPRYVVLEGDESVPVHYDHSRAGAEQWVIVQLLTDEILNQLDTADDAVLDLVEEILISVLRIDPELDDLGDPSGPWLRSEDYVLSLLPQALHQAGDVLAEEFRRKGLNPEPRNPVSNPLHSI